MTKKQFKPESRRVKQKGGNVDYFQKLLSRTYATRERAKTKRPYRYLDTTWFSLRLRPIKIGMVHSFMVLLDIAITKEELKKRMVKGFGDLEQNKKNV